ncbi:Neurolysin [Colletotrichum sp. SAR 10_70]|nr:Neurolysin [Colletotrichum sp. SAR 10_71]KAI8157011.1 Neurolysin [Colletotrichum sp. SAR 10_65]KAI8167979.1 Neurolysin [Colletotrichum sp. SAR 10_70]KAI8204533.1 Neurolysin [Colletotrichum sp. SAR 10_76]KAI8234520.1 Neurolysin [Colletotrichum sp. SAR 10_86]KAJ4998572.1 Neurolysin [Colletotrichum sp. SAR 10_66]
MLSADEIVPLIKRFIAEQSSIRDTLVKTISPSEACYQNVIAPIQAVDDAIQGEAGVYAMLRYSGPDELTRQAVQQAQELWSAAGGENLKRKDVYELIQAVKDNNEDLGYEERKILEDMWSQFRRAGHGALDEEQIKMYLNRRERIEELKRDFQNNLSGKGTGLWFEKDELEGVSAQEMVRWKEEDGKLFVPLERGDNEAVQRYANNPETRKRMFAAYDVRLVENVPLYKEMIILRDENARMLGYRNHADFRIRERTAPSTEWVDEFLNKLIKNLLPKGRGEIERLEAKKRSHLAVEEAEILPWDYQYYTRLLEEEANVEHELISEYFPLKHTLSSMLGLFNQFLGLDFVPVPEEDLVGKLWAENIEVWSVWEGRGESKGEFVGYLYADLIWREGKYRGNCNVNLQCSYIKGDELGHALHDLICRTKYTRFHGTRVKPDFGEAPSTMLENWCWMPDELVKMSRHYTRVDPAYAAKWKEDHDDAELPAEKIDEKLVERLVESRRLNRALWFLRQILFAKFDLDVNNQKSTDAVRELDEVNLYNDLKETLTLTKSPEKNSVGYVQSNHLITLYDAGYFSAHAFAADFFESNFAKDPRDPEAWDRYRHGILKYGASKQEMEFMTEFLGRESGPGALLRSLGLSTS